MSSAIPFSRARLLVGCLALGALVACGDDDSTGSGEIVRVEIEGAAETDTLGVGGTLNLQQIILDAGNRVVEGAEFDFTSTAENVATVDELGAVEAVGVGAAKIMLEAGGIRDSVILTVVRTELRGGSTTMLEGTTTQFTAALVGPGGDIAGADIEFSSSDEEVLTVDEDGTVTAVGPGTAEIFATWSGPHGDVEDSVEITVNPLIPPLPAGVRR